MIAPDLPGFGFTIPSKEYVFTFDAISRSVEEFIDSFNLQDPMPVYIFDYGAPTTLRIFLRRPELFSTIISQNGNAYEQGLGPAWEQFGIRAYWRENSKEKRDALRILFTLENTRLQYNFGHPCKEQINPETYTLDFYLSNERIEGLLDLFYDYKNNVALYPKFTKALQERSEQISVLAIWGRNDPFFIPSGAEAFKNDVKNTKVILLDAGHFALESHTKEIAQEIFSFLNVAQHENV